MIIDRQTDVIHVLRLDEQASRVRRCLPGPVRISRGYQDFARSSILADSLRGQSRKRVLRQDHRQVGLTFASFGSRQAGKYLSPRDRSSSTGIQESVTSSILSESRGAKNEGLRCLSGV